MAEIFEKIWEFCSKLSIEKLQKTETSIILVVINTDTCIFSNSRYFYHEIGYLKKLETSQNVRRKV